MLDLTGHREESWGYELLDLNDKPMGPLEGVAAGGKLLFNIHNTIRSGGQIPYHGETLDWRDWRIKITHTVKVGGESMTWPLGVFIPVSPETTHTGKGNTQVIELMDKLQVLNEDKFDGTLFYPAGSKVSDLVKAIIYSANEEKVLIEETNSTLRTSMAWEPGTTKLRVINDLLDTANFFSLYCDGEGYFRASKYVKPADRPVYWKFEEGQNCIFADQFERTHDNFKIPNKFITISQSSKDEPGLRGVAVNQADYERRGRWIVEVEEGVEAASQEIIDELADRKLRSKANIGTTLELEHAALEPSLNSRVTFQGHGVKTQAVIQSMEVPLGVGELTATTLRELTDESV